MPCLNVLWSRLKKEIKCSHQTYCTMSIAPYTDLTLLTWLFVLHGVAVLGLTVANIRQIRLAQREWQRDRNSPDGNTHYGKYAPRYLFWWCAITAFGPFAGVAFLAVDWATLRRQKGTDGLTLQWALWAAVVAVLWSTCTKVCVRLGLFLRLTTQKCLEYPTMLQGTNETAAVKSAFAGSAAGGTLILVAQIVRHSEPGGKICALIGCGLCQLPALVVCAAMTRYSKQRPWIAWANAAIELICFLAISTGIPFRSFALIMIVSLEGK